MSAAAPRRAFLLSDLHRGSFAIIGGLYRASLEEAGLSVQELPTPQDAEERAEVAALCKGALVLHNTLGEGFEPVPEATNVALPVHEWSRYPTRWAARLNRFDAVWVTTQHVREVLRASGVSIDIAIVPPALDRHLPPPKTDWAAHTPFRFFFLGEPHFRKGQHLLMAGFALAFPQPGEAELTLKTSPDCDWSSPRPDIRLIRERWARETLLAAYAEQDCFVSASLGEGLGLPVAEAVLAGLPVATNSWGGHGSLLRPAGYFPISHRVVEQPFASRPEFYAPGQQCALSSPEAIAQTLRHVYESHAQTRQTIAETARKYLLATYGREATQATLAHALHCLHDKSSLTLA